jgi:hypothetical protein
VFEEAPAAIQQGGVHNRTAADPSRTGSEVHACGTAMADLPCTSEQTEKQREKQEKKTKKKKKRKPQVGRV